MRYLSSHLIQIFLYMSRKELKKFITCHSFVSTLLSYHTDKKLNYMLNMFDDKFQCHCNYYDNVATNNYYSTLLLL